MPYTAPLKTSPSAEHIEHSDPTTPPSPSSPTEVDSHARTTQSPNSYSYLRRHRRSPSGSKSFVFPDADNSWKSVNITDSHASIRQSPPPVSEGPIPPGALLSPPESAQNSSDEDSTHQPREQFQLEELEAAVRSIEQRRMSSPERQSPDVRPSSSKEPINSNQAKQLRPVLVRDHRKISHSRSFVASQVGRKHEEALTSSPEESDRDDEPRVKHPMVRKKSGELVRPALRPPSARRRPSSMPGTPTYSKAVHFDAQLEHIRHFLQLDKPQAVSAGSSPVEDFQADGEYPFANEGQCAPSYEWELRLSNFPRNPSARAHQRVRLERLSLSSDRSTLVGVVAVANLAYHKHVIARFTFDSWKTTSEVTAEFSQDDQRAHTHDGYDRFSFNINLNEQTNLERKTMYICIRYLVNGQEFWDNNNTMNYQVNFNRVPKARSKAQRAPPVRPHINLPRSRSFAGRPHSMPSSLSDFSSVHRYISFGPPLSDRKEKSGGEEEGPHDVEAPVPIRRDKQGHQIFGNRYDFESSLSAAIRTKPEHDRTTLIARAKSETSVSGSGSRNLARSAASNLQTSHSTNDEPSSLLSGKPNRESHVYKELVDRYCFFGSPGSSPSLNRPLTVKDSKESTPSSSTSRSSSPSQHSPTEAGNEAPRNVPRSSASLAYKYLEPMQDNIFKEAHTPAAIRG